MVLTYRKVASSSLSWLVAHSRIFRLFLKEKIDAYVLWPFAERVQNWIVNSGPILATLRYLRQSQNKYFQYFFLLSFYVHCALRHKETRFAWISNVDSRKYQVGYKLQKLSRQVSVVLAGPKKNEFKALLKLKFLTAILLAVLEMAYFFIISLLLNLLYDMSCSMWVWYMTSVLGFWNYRYWL